MNKKIILGIIVVAVTLIVVALGIIGWREKKVIEQPQVVKVGTLGPLTGGAAEYGVSARNGAQLATSQLNQKQSKYQYELVNMDDKADSSLAVKGAQDLVQNKEIMTVVGSITSSCTIAAGEVFQKAGLPAVSPSATSPKVSLIGDFQFRVCPSDTYQGKSLAEFVVQDLGFYRIAIFWDEKNADYSGELANSFTQRAEHLGATITERISYRAGQKEFKASLERLKATSPEALLIPGYYTEAALIAQATRAMGWNISIVGGDGLYSPGLIEIGGKTVDGIRFTSFFSADNPDARVQDFVSAYETSYGEEPGWLVAHAYDAMNVIAQAIEKEGPSREGIQKGLSEIERFEGITGLISFDENGDVIKDILRLEVKDGKFKVWSL